jgi:hypothetical protein
MPGTKTFVSGDVLTAADMNAYARGGLVMAHASKTADQAFTTLDDVTDLSITFSAISGRLYQIDAYAQFVPQVADDIAYLIIADGSNNNMQVGTVALPNTSYGMAINVRLLWGASSSGSVTFKCRAASVLSLGTVTLAAAASRPAQISAVDIGAT